MVARPPKIDVPPMSTDGDGREKVALALVAEEVLVLQGQEHARRGRQPAHQREELDLPLTTSMPTTRATSLCRR